MSRWHAEPSGYIILTQDPETRRGIPEGDMKRKYPRTYAYLKKFEHVLRKRSGYRQYFKPTDPFWSVYNVGPYSLAPWKVAWPGEVAPSLRVAVVGKHMKKPVLCDQTNYFVDCAIEDQANFLNAMLNSSCVRLYYDSLAYKHTSMDFIKGLALPQFDATISAHNLLSELSRQCQRAAAEGDTKGIEALEAKLDRAAAKLWGVTDDELKSIQQALNEGSRRERGESDDEAE